MRIQGALKPAIDLKTKPEYDKRIAVYLVLLGVILALNFLAPLIAPYDPNAIEMSSKLTGPTAAHLLGTDNLGRDILSRCLYGGRSSILLAAAATACSMLLGLVLGVLAGYFGGAADVGITLVTNIFQGLPGMTMMIALAAALGPGTKSLILSLVLTSWIGFSRFVRGEVIKVRRESYVESVTCFGAGHAYVIIKTILPNIRANLLVLFTTRIGRSILSVSGLSYLGLGIQPPTPDWGAMLSDSRRYFRSAPQMFLAPGVCIILFSLVVNLLGDALRDKLDVKKDERGEW